LKKAKARAREAGTWGIQQPENTDAPKQRETLTETLKRSISEDNTPMKSARLPKKTLGLQ
jgi:hypothetical protein